MRSLCATCQILRSFDYVDRVNRAVDYITTNLDQPLLLEEVARAACFRPTISTGSFVP